MRSSIRTVVALSRLPEAEANPKFSAFLKTLKAEHGQKLESAQFEFDSREGGIDAMDTS